jgi:alpha-mannosidase
MDDRVREIRRTLGVPDSIDKVLFLEPSAHLDWDWAATFEGYYSGVDSPHQAVSTTFTEAIALVEQYRQSSPPYPYTICEMAYLQRFLQDYPAQASVLQGFGDLLQISGGGFVSADNLLSHREAFIRNYLLGQVWMTNAIGPHATPNLWIPDDFGHDEQLPALIEAMGFTGVSFWRIPGDTSNSGAPCNNCALPVPTSPYSIFTNEGVDRMWTSSDGSAVQAHWLYQSYCQGNGALCPQDAPVCPVASGLSTLVGSLPVAATPYFFVPIDCDFVAPFDGSLLSIVSEWNATSAATTGVYVVVGSFNLFMDLVAWSSNNRTQLPSSALTLNPYYSGSYGSRMDLKAKHYGATRMLLQAESLAVLLDALAATQGGAFATEAQRVNGEIATAWNTLIPSTHHDFITGTAVDAVYTGEQQVVLGNAITQANEALTDVQMVIANAVAPSTAWADGLAVVFNGAPTMVSALAEVATAPNPFPGASAPTPNGPWTPTQRSSDGTLLCLASAPALGYGLTYFSESESGTAPDLWYALVGDGGIVLNNAWLSATIDANGCLSALTDLASGVSLLSGAANAVLFYIDGGSIYRFGYESNLYSTNPEYWRLDTDTTVTWQPPTLVETGPLRLRVLVSGTVTVNGAAIPFTQEYRLAAGSSSLWMSTTGSAPSGYSVMLSFPLTETIAALQHGTTAHWTKGVPRSFFQSNTGTGGCEVPTTPLTFEATHDYVLPTEASGAIVAGFYHAATPAWAIDDANGQNLLACILRNAPASVCQAVSGTDSGEHTAVYAIAVPSALTAPSSGQPLCDALAFNSPLVAVQPTTSAIINPLPPSLSIASTGQEDAIVSAVKSGDVTPGELIVRLYQPTNGSMEVVVTVADLIAQNFTSGGVLNVAARTALERSTDVDLNLTSTASAFSLTMARAMATVALVP